MAGDLRPCAQAHGADPRRGSLAGEPLADESRVASASERVVAGKFTKVAKKVANLKFMFENSLKCRHFQQGDASRYFFITVTE